MLLNFQLFSEILNQMHQEYYSPPTPPSSLTFIDIKFFTNDLSFPALFHLLYEIVSVANLSFST